MRELGLDRHALGDVREVPGHAQRAAVGAPEDRAVDLDPDLAAVLGQAANAVAPGRLTGDGLADPLGGRLALVVGHHRPGHRPADDLLGGPAEDPLRRRVPDGHRLIHRERLGRQRRPVHDRRQERARALEAGLRGVAGRDLRLGGVERGAQAGGRAPAQSEREGDKRRERGDGDARRRPDEQDARRPDEDGERDADTRDNRGRDRREPEPIGVERALDEGDADQRRDDRDGDAVRQGHRRGKCLDVDRDGRGKQEWATPNRRPEQGHDRDRQQDARDDEPRADGWTEREAQDRAREGDQRTTDERRSEPPILARRQQRFRLDAR